MSLKIGELAKHTGLTVRTLHHYDNIGLLTPSARSDNGYRLYQRGDIARLHQIQALRRFGLSLADIGTFLSRPDTPVSDIVARQIAALNRQIEQASTLRNQLSQLQQQLKHGIEPGLADWLSTLELMTMYDNYFTKEEIARLPYFNADSPQRQEWRTLVAQATALMASNTPPDDAAAQKLAHQWLVMSERDSDGDADLALRLHAMLTQEPSARQESGMTPAIETYLSQAAGAFRLTLYARYLNADELQRLRDSGKRDAQRWPELVASLQRQMRAGAAPSSAPVQELARQWLQLLNNMTGGDPAMRDKIRLAHEKEAMLLTGTWMNEAMLAYMREAMSSK